MQEAALTEKVPPGSPDPKIESFFKRQIASCISVYFTLRGSQLIQCGRNNRTIFEFDGELESGGCFWEVIIDHKGKLSSNIAVLRVIAIFYTTVFYEVGNFLIPYILFLKAHWPVGLEMLYNSLTQWLDVILDGKPKDPCHPDGRIQVILLKRESSVEHDVGSEGIGIF